MWWPSKENGRPVTLYIVEIYNLNEKYWKRHTSLYTFDSVAVCISINLSSHCHIQCFRRQEEKPFCKELIQRFQRFY